MESAPGHVGGKPLSAPGGGLGARWVRWARGLGRGMG